MRSIILLVIVGIVVMLFIIFRFENYENLEKISFKANKTIVKLPEPRYDSNTSIEEALLRRRSIREYSSEPLSLAEVSQLLWAAQGITSKWGGRTSPSAGATYPLELYVVVGEVKDLEKGVYKYDPKKHELRKVLDKDVREELGEAAFGQQWVKNAAIVIVFSAVYERTTKIYGERGIRYVHMEVGHAAQNVYLQAVSLELGTVVVGAFDDEKVKEILKIKEDPLYLMPVGKIKTTKPFALLQNS